MGCTSIGHRGRLSGNDTAGRNLTTSFKVLIQIEELVLA